MKRAFKFYKSYAEILSKYTDRGEYHLAAELMYAIGNYAFNCQLPKGFSCKELESDWGEIFKTLDRAEFQ